MNNARSDLTVLLLFGQAHRTIDDIRHDIRPVVNNDNFVPEITPYLKILANFNSREIFG